MTTETRDNVLGSLMFAAFILALPVLYVSPMIFNAITDLVIR